MNKFNKAVGVNSSHGYSFHPIYPRWINMMNRCYNPLSKKFRRYGARGIKVCEDWHNIENFINDVGFPPTELHSLDRINVHGNYEPSNVRWATQKQQQNNRGNTRFITAFGKTKNIISWAEETGIRAAIIRQRIDRDGWSVEKSLSTRINK